MKKIVLNTKALHWKLGTRSAIVIVLLVFIIGGIAIQQADKIEYKSAVRTNQVLSGIMAERFEENSQAFVHQIDFVSLDGELQALITQAGSSESDSFYRNKQLRSVISLRSIVMGEISGVYLYDQAGALMVKWEKTPNKQNVYKLSNSTDISCYAPDGRVTVKLMDGHLVYDRALRTLETRETVGYISFLYDERYLQEKLESIKGDQTRFIGLYDSVNKVLLCNDRQNKAAYAQALAGQDFEQLGSGVSIQVENVGEMLVCGKQVINEGWYLLSGVPSEDIYEVGGLVLLITAAFALVAVLVIFVVTLLNRAIVTGPIDKIIGAVQKVQNQDYAVHLNVKTGDEIELLANNFNTMAQRINELVNQNLKASLAYRESQFAQLCHQIKPHFLYNTLECINALSQMGRTEDVRTVTVALAKLMKNKMSDSCFTTVDKEVDCAKAFLQIYKIMQADDLNYFIQVDPACGSLQIPSLIVQPIVENAVLHGIIPSTRPGTCTVKAVCENDMLHISVSDDGEGFPPGKMQAVSAYIKGQATKQQAALLGIGLKNCIDRVRMEYGAEGTILLLSDREWGTVFEMILPQIPAQPQGCTPE